jgi:hypothetical protein
MEAALFSDDTRKEWFCSKYFALSILAPWYLVVLICRQSTSSDDAYMQFYSLLQHTCVQLHLGTLFKYSFGGATDIQDLMVRAVA